MIEGETITAQDAEEIFEAILQRQRNFPGEPPIISFTLVLMGIGKRAANLKCMGGEWSGTPLDVPMEVMNGSSLRCPNGHGIWKEDAGLHLTWIRKTIDPQG